MKSVKNLLLVVLAALMMSCGWLGGTAFVTLGGFVPLLMLAAEYDRSARSFWMMTGWTMLFIALWYAASVWWVWYAEPAGPIAATFFAWVYTGGAFLVWFFVSQRVPKSLSYTVLVAAWTVGEWIYNFNQASFPWLALGGAFSHETWAVQWYEWTGLYGGTVWVLVTSIVIYEFLIVRRAAPLKVGRWLPPVLAVVVPVGISLVLYSTHTEPARTTKVTIVQPNIDPYAEKFALAQSEQTANLTALVATALRDVSFVVMPETAIDEGVLETDIDSSPSIDALRGVAAEHAPHATVVVGAITYRLYGARKTTPTARGNDETGYYDIYNSALALAPDGGAAIHHKSKLVIGAEMIPTWWWVGALGLDRVVTNLGGVSGQLGWGGDHTVFESGGVKAGAAICWESVFGEYFAGFVREGAEVMMVITNDGWWRDTPGYRQHFNFSRLRAIETRRAIVRSANTGRSGVIDSRGDVGETLGWGKRGTITAEVAVGERITLYVRFGDWVCRISLLVLGLSLLYFTAYLVRKKNNLVK